MKQGVVDYKIALLGSPNIRFQTAAPRVALAALEGSAVVKPWAPQSPPRTQPGARVAFGLFAKNMVGLQIVLA